MYDNEVPLLEITMVTALENGYYLATTNVWNRNSSRKREEIYHAHIQAELYIS